MRPIQSEAQSIKHPLHKPKPKRAQRKILSPPKETEVLVASTTRPSKENEVPVASTTIPPKENEVPVTSTTIPPKENELSVISTTIPQIPARKCLLAIGNLENIVANGYVIDTGSDRIHGILLGSENVRVHVSDIEPDHLEDELPIPVNDEMYLVTHAVKSMVAWPKSLVIYEDDVSIFF